MGRGFGVDVDPDPPAEVAPKRAKRKSRSTYSARTIAECRRRGWAAGNVERRIPFPRPQGTTIDLFGVIDIIAIDPTAPHGQQTIGIQATSGGTGGSHAPHRAKIQAAIRDNAEVRLWLGAGNRLELWSWAKQGAGKRKLWTLRVEVFTLDASPRSAERAAPDDPARVVPDLLAGRE